ncbi:cytochrome c1 [Pseudomonadota bacterium]
MKRLLAIFGALAMLSGMGTAVAGASGTIKEVDIPASEEARKRGAEIVVSTCMMCHSLKYLKFNHLKDIGMTKEEITYLLDDQKLDDKMMSVTPVEVRKESYGIVPPDLSVMAIARKQGPQYIYTLLTSYYYNEAEENDSHLFPGIKMPDTLGYSDTEEGSADRAEVEGQAKDIAAFLTWAADPNAEARRSIGVYVIIYLILMSILLYLCKKRVWSRVHEGKM